MYLPFLSLRKLTWVLEMWAQFLRAYDPLAVDLNHVEQLTICYSKCRGPKPPWWPLRAVRSWTRSSSHIHIEFRNKNNKFKVLYPFFSFEILLRFLCIKRGTYILLFLIPHPPNFHVKHYKGRNNITICWFLFSFCHWFFSLGF